MIGSSGGEMNAGALNAEKAQNTVGALSPLQRIIWRRSTLPHSLPCSTIDAKELNFRVRDGNGWSLFAIATRLKWLDPELLIAVCLYLSKRS
jgi:hypothetical protein